VFCCFSSVPSPMCFGDHTLINVTNMLFMRLIIQ